MKVIIVIALLIISLSGCKEDDKSGGLVLPPGKGVKLQPEVVQKTNNLPVYMHYMPWFDAPSTGSGWGIHWTMSTKNPEVIENGKRQIASHYYPLIGPYDSQDEDVINYHLLLMKYAGIDGVLINWYGVEGTNSDIDDLLINSNAIVDRTSEVGMQFSVVLEDRFAGDIEDTKANIQYLQHNYYTHKQYIHHANRPLTLLFGPISITGQSNWSEILNVSSDDEIFMPLWYKGSSVGEGNVGGEYAWVYRDGLGGLSSFYNSKTEDQFVGGGAYPGFKDYYTEGGWDDGINWEIDVTAGQLTETLDLAIDKRDKLDFIQLITWNDFGEGTMIEPTVEFEFQFLEEIQAFTGVTYGEEELTLIYDWYTKTKDPIYAEDEEAASNLEQVFYYLVALKVDEAKSLIEKI